MRRVNKWEAERSKEEKINISMRPIEIMSFAWEVAKESLLSSWIDEIDRKIEEERKARGDDTVTELDEINYAKEVSKIIPPSWHKEILQRAVIAYYRKHGLTYGDGNE